ncbi:MAG: heavy metal-associated domain-containing protein [Chloroflexi bacterium]|nr:heavy metal-associated domain-containing protein [Chloroflexota bacterium]
MFKVIPGRLRHAPSVRSIEGAPGEAVVRIDGMVCSVCATRTAAALEAVEGVEEARVDLASGTARLRLAPGATVQREALDRSLSRVVVGMRARRWLEHALRGGRR